MKSRSRDSFIRRYLHLPHWVRQHTDKAYQSKRSFDSQIETRARKGKPQLIKLLKKNLRGVFGK